MRPQELLELNAAVADYLKATAAFEVGKLAVQKVRHGSASEICGLLVFDPLSMCQ